MFSIYKIHMCNSENVYLLKYIYILKDAGQYSKLLSLSLYVHVYY